MLKLDKTTTTKYKNILLIILILTLILQTINFTAFKNKTGFILNYEDENFSISPFYIILNKRLSFINGFTGLKSKHQLGDMNIKILNEDLLNKNYNISICINDECSLLDEGNNLKKEYNFNEENRKLFNTNKYNSNLFLQIENKTFIKINIANKEYNLKLNVI